MRRLAFCLLAVMMLVPLAQARADGDVFDDGGVLIPQGEYSRAVSLHGSFADMWLTAGGRLAGVTQEAIDEMGLALETDTLIIGTTKNPSIEAIMAVEPEIVIYSLDIAAQEQAAAVLRDAGICCAGFRVDTYKDYERAMKTLTGLTGRGDVLESFVEPMVGRIEDIIARERPKAAPEILLIRAYSYSAKAKGSDNLAGAILKDLGCVNIADGDGAILEDLSLESIVISDPDYIFVTVMGDEQAGLASLDASFGQNPAWQSLTAVKEGRMHVLPAPLFHFKPNGRWDESYGYAWDLLYGS